MLAEARTRIVRHSPEEAAAAAAVIVDLRSSDERAPDGVIPGSVHVPRSVLEWRCDSSSDWANPAVADARLHLVLVCAHGYSSSLAAAALVDLGFEHAGDIIGGFAWQAAGLPVAPAPPAVEGLPGMGGPE